MCKYLNKYNRLGEVSINKQGLKMTIIRYGSSNDIDIEFEDGYIIRNREYKEFKKKTVLSHLFPSVYNVGFTNGENTRDEKGKKLKSYNTWKGMMERCYSEEYKAQYPTYKECTVKSVWHNYSNFKKWFDENYYETEGNNIRMELDKDILIKGNKMYSPDTCVFVPMRINYLFTNRKTHRGKFPIGVHYMNNRYIAQLTKEQSGKKFLGAFDTPEKAFNAYKQAKEKYIQQVADEYKDKIPKKLYDAMYNYQVEITD